MAFAPLFFEVVAQLIPLVFLALVVEDKLQPEDDETPMTRVLRTWCLVFLVVGEVVTLAVVAGGLPPSNAIGGFLAMLLLMAALFVILPVIGRELADQTMQRSRRERFGHATAGVAAIVGILLTVVLVWVTT